ncbi:MAG: hypothetical protein V4709_02940 [Pseudomonadota bacterium]
MDGTNPYRVHGRSISSKKLTAGPIEYRSHLQQPTNKTTLIFVKILRAMLIWGLALSLPTEGMAASSMTHCKDMQEEVSSTSMQGQNHHDHAAMMASMSSDSSMAQMHDDTQSGADDKPAKATKVGCQCGCQCGGNCAMGCPGITVSLSQIGFSFDSQSASTRTALPRSQAHAAYRDAPLRPPSAVAL